MRVMQVPEGEAFFGNNRHQIYTEIVKVIPSTALFGEDGET
jgi:hypothetical protein